MAFVMVFSHSRQIFLRFFPDAPNGEFSPRPCRSIRTPGVVHSRATLRQSPEECGASNDVATRSDAPSGVPALRRRLSLRAAPLVAVARGNEKGRGGTSYTVRQGAVPSQHAPSLILMTSTLRRRPGASVPPPIGAAQSEPEAHCPCGVRRRKTTFVRIATSTTRSQCSSSSVWRSRSARRRTSAST